MSVARLLDRSTRRARMRGAANAVLLGTPAVALAAAVAWRAAAAPAAVETAAAGAAALAAFALAHARRFDAAWVTRRLDARLPGLEDSAGLLAVERATLPPLRRLQRDRVEARLAADTAEEVAPAVPTRAIGLALAAGLAGVAAVLAWPAPDRLSAVRDGAPPPAGAPRLVAARLRVTPPAYTGLPARDLPGLDAQVPQGSRLEWTLRFAPSPSAAELTGADGARLPLAQAGGDWRGTLVLDRSRLYRVSPRTGAPLPAPPLHRLDAVPDTPPQVRVVEPAQTLTITTDGRRPWRLVFDVTDDYGAAPDARLKLTLADGAGEQVTFHERELTLHGGGPARRRRFTAALDPAAQGLKPGADLVAQLFVSDTRAPAPQTAAGPSLILRWPVAPEATGEGLEGAVKKVLPAYLRSERQVIIDAQALLRERPRLAPDRFLARSDGLGADQQGLRLRYGQFLGGENEHAENAMPTSDADDDAAPAKAPEAAPAPPPAFGKEGDITRTYGHAHDETESSALEPTVRDRLKLSVDQMWQAETHLRQGDPAGALPFAEKALAYLKEAQRAERVFVPRTGLQTPPIDEARRLTGKRDGLTRDPLAFAAAEPPDPVRRDAWRALADAPDGAIPAEALEAVARWSRAGAHGADPLAAAAALDAVRRDPDCARCRRTLRGLVWSALPRPPPHAAARPATDAQGRRYLQALAGGGAP